MKRVLCLLLVSYMVGGGYSCRLTAKSTRIFGRVIDAQQQPIPNVEIIISAAEHGLPPHGYILAIPKTNREGIYDTTVTVAKQYYKIELLLQPPTDSLQGSRYRSLECRCNGGNPSRFPTVEVGATSECNYTLTP